MNFKTLIAISFTALTFFVACNNAPDSQVDSTSENETSDKSTENKYLEKGKAIAGQTFTTLAGQLQKSISEGGVPKAIEYCNLSAYPLVDSLSKIHRVNIRRTSLKVRNLKNSPTALEKEILDQYALKALKNEPLKPIVHQGDNKKFSFFAPINVNSFCLQCHGEIGKTLSIENFNVIQKYYPDDMAIGYMDGDFRGIWSIQFFEN